MGSRRTGGWNTATEMCALIRFITDTGLAPDIVHRMFNLHTVFIGHFFIQEHLNLTFTFCDIQTNNLYLLLM